MTQEQSLSPFEGLESFKGYSEEERVDYIKTLLNIDENILTGDSFINSCDVEGTLEILSQLRWYKDFIEFIYNYGKQFVIDYVESQKGVKVFDGKFSVATINNYDFSQNDYWKSIKNEEKQLSEFRKQLEKTCQTGGNFDGKDIQKLEPKIDKQLRFTIEK
jgi:hypothetical protein